MERQKKGDRPTGFDGGLWGRCAHHSVGDSGGYWESKSCGMGLGPQHDPVPAARFGFIES